MVMLVIIAIMNDHDGCVISFEYNVALLTHIIRVVIQKKKKRIVSSHPINHHLLLVLCADRASSC
uniref:Uncharacterized protein n=1 Tax=Wuchereria bancrofti TaxID=6293 RepID=A0A1I8EEW2_WUCBA